MKCRIWLLGLALVCGACTQLIESVVTKEDLTKLMGSPASTGFVVIGCEMKGEMDGLTACSIIKQGNDRRYIKGVEQLGGFVFPSLSPGRYYVTLIQGYRWIDAGDDDARLTVDYYYDFPPWQVREMVFEVAVGVPLHVGKVVLKGPRLGRGEETKTYKINDMHRSDVVHIDSAEKHERDVWKRFLERYPESVWSEAVRGRLAELQ